MPLTPQAFEHIILEFVALQSALQDGFLKKHETVRDWNYFTDVPRHGHIDVSGARWDYFRHGIGVRFESEMGIVIDIHNLFLEKNIVDAYRISEYLLSKFKGMQDDLDIYIECEKKLKNAELDGFIREFDPDQRSWKLV
jgi:hypothetical protein